MHLRLIVGLLLVLPLALAAQQKTALSVELNANDGLLFLQKTIDPPANTKEKVIMQGSYGLGLQLSRPLRRSYFVRTGLGYRHSQLRHEISGLQFGSDIVQGTRSTIHNDIAVSSIYMPLEFGRWYEGRLDKRAFVWGLSALGSRNLAASADTWVIYEKLPPERIVSPNNDIAPWSVALGVFCGLEYTLRNEMVLGLEPHVRMTFTDYRFFLYDTHVRRMLEGGLRLRLQFK